MVASGGWRLARRLDVGRGGFGWQLGYFAGASGEARPTLSADEFVEKRRSDASTWQLFCLGLQQKPRK
jgi:hypothetical protein